MTKEFLTLPEPAAYESLYALAQLKRDLVITSSVMDARITRLRAAAVRIFEQTARCVILERTVRARFREPEYQCDPYGVLTRYKDVDKTQHGLTLPGFVKTVTSVHEGATLIDPSRYRVTNNRIDWLDATAVLERRILSKETTVVYEAGLATNSQDRPTVVQALFEMIAFWNAFPGEVNEGSSLAVPQAASLIMNSFWTPRG